VRQEKKELISIQSRRRAMNVLSQAGAILTVCFGLFWLGWILLTLLRFGLPGMSLHLFTELTPPPGSPGGIINALVGTFLIVMLATLIGTPVGILAGTYLAEYGQTGWLAPVTGFVNDILLSAPSIVLGLFVYETYVIWVGHFSGIAGSFALGLLVIPVVVRTTENMLKLVPNRLREAAAALGAPQWKIITMITLKASRAGIITGILLAVARISGETAPLLFTALNNMFWSKLNQPTANLPVMIFDYAMSPYKDWHALAWAGALLITLSVLGLNILARSFFKQMPLGR
jgi:phosphate transport system permease protein